MKTLQVQGKPETRGLAIRCQQSQSILKTALPGWGRKVRRALYVWPELCVCPGCSRLLYHDTGGMSSLDLNVTPMPIATDLTTCGQDLPPRMQRRGWLP